MRPARIAAAEWLLGAGYASAVLISLIWIADRRSLWYDELFTWYLCNLPDARAIVQALLEGTDNGPPADYLLRHASMKLFGANPLAFRLPSVLSFLVAGICLHRCVRGEGGRLAALSAATVPAASAMVAYGAEGRAYAPLFALGAFVLWTWKIAPDSRHRALSWSLLALALFVSPLVHYYGVLNYAPVFVGEAARSLRRRRVDPVAVAALCAPIAAALLVIPFARNAVAMRSAFWASDFDIATAATSYGLLLGSATIPVLLLSLIGVLAKSWRIDLRVAALVSAATPFLVFVLALLWTNAMTERYAIGCVAGLSLLVGGGVAVIARRSSWLAFTLLAVGWAASAANLHRTALAATAPPLEPAFEELVRESELPIVFDSPQRFLESHSRMDGPQAAKLRYLLDQERSRAHLGYDNDEIALANLRRIEPVGAIAFDEFVAATESFYLLVGPRRYWLEAELRRLGWQLSELREVGRNKLYLCAAPGS